MREEGRKEARNEEKNETKKEKTTNLLPQPELPVPGILFAAAARLQLRDPSLLIRQFGAVG